MFNEIKIPIIDMRLLFDDLYVLYTTHLEYK